MPGGKRGVGFLATKGVERELGLGKEVRPAVGRKRDVDSRQDRDNVLVGDVMFYEDGSEVGRDFVI